MIKETINSKQELVKFCSAGYKMVKNKELTKNDFCMFFGFSHCVAIERFYPDDVEQLLEDGGFNRGSKAYFQAGINAGKAFNAGKYSLSLTSTIDKFVGSRDYLQTIYYGAPGTGKSYKVNELTKGCDVIRTTFHPDYDYASFVGCYKPVEVSKNVVTGLEEIKTYLLSESELIKIYKEIISRYSKNNTGVGRSLFSSLYWRCFSSKYQNLNIDNFVAKADPGSELNSKIRTYVNFFEELENKNSLIRTELTYQFRPQAFVKAYVKAWKKFVDGLKGCPDIEYDSTLSIDHSDEIEKRLTIDGSPLNLNVVEPENENEKDNEEEKNNKNGSEDSNRQEGQYVYPEKSTSSIIPVFLVIEEINRGNCAQIFGDLFQLLDRQENGFSEYPIEADADLQKAIQKAFAEEPDFKLVSDIAVDYVLPMYKSAHGGTLSSDIQNGYILLLPPNLNILATMNTSDQSLFPMDSAFKRRWDWEFVPINYSDADGINIEISEEEAYSWGTFIKKVNEKIKEATSSADKQLGNRFVRVDDSKKITLKQFVNKVMFYLWNDIYKDMEKGDDGYIFENVDSFESFFEPTDDNAESLVDGINKERVNKFITQFEGVVNLIAPKSGKDTPVEDK